MTFLFCTNAMLIKIDDKKGFYSATFCLNPFVNFQNCYVKNTSNKNFFNIVADFLQQRVKAIY